jgi:hypothetical protein
LSKLLLLPEQRWECPNCTKTDITHEAQMHTRFHRCGGLAGMTAPMVPAGTSCKVEAIEREAYIGKEIVTYDKHHRPIMSVRTTRDDGEDLAVFPGVASVRLREML